MAVRNKGRRKIIKSDNRVVPFSCLLDKSLHSHFPKKIEPFPDSLQYTGEGHNSFAKDVFGWEQ